VIQVLLDLHLLATHPAAEIGSPDLMRHPAPTHGVVLRHGPHFHLAEYRIQLQTTMRISGLLRGASEAPVP
jgi:hypothetical protein